MANPSPNVGSHTSFKGIAGSCIGAAQFKENLEINILEFCRWSCLGIGAFYNFFLPGSGAYGGSFTRLRLSEDPNYLEGQVWEGPRQDWVWESGVQYSTQPIAISGVYVDGTFYPNGSAVPVGGNFSINYPYGRILFQNPLATDSVVECEYSARLWQFSPASVPWWRGVQYNSLRPDDFQYLSYGSGAWSVMAEHRVQLPHVIVDCTPRQSFVGWQLGLGTRVSQEVMFHILGEEQYDTKTMSDIITAQREKTIILFDKNAILASGAMPLNPDGTIASGARCYPDLVHDFEISRAAILEMSSDYVTNSPPLYHSAIRATVQVDVPW